MGFSGPASSHEMMLGVTFESLQGNEALSPVDRDIGVFSNGGMTPEFLSSFKVRPASS